MIARVLSEGLEGLVLKDLAVIYIFYTCYPGLVKSCFLSEQV